MDQAAIKYLTGETWKKDKIITYHWSRGICSGRVAIVDPRQYRKGALRGVLLERKRNTKGVVCKKLDKEEMDRKMTKNNNRLTKAGGEVGIDWWWYGRVGRCSLSPWDTICEEDGGHGVWWLPIPPWQHGVVWELDDGDIYIYMHIAGRWWWMNGDVVGS